MMNAKMTIKTHNGLFIKSANDRQSTPKTMKIDENRTIPFSSVKISLIGKQESVETITNSPKVKDPGAYFIRHEMTIRPNMAVTSKIKMFSFVRENRKVTSSVTMILNRKSVDGTSVGERIKSKENMISTNMAG